MAVRVTRQTVEVLMAPSNLEPLVESTLNLTQEAKQKGVSQSAANILDLNQTVEDNTIDIDSENQLSLVQSAEHNLKFPSVSNILSLSDLAERGQELLESLSNILSFTQAVDQNLEFESVSNLLNFNQDIILVTNNDITVGLKNDLTLIDEAEVGNFVFNRSVETSNLEFFLTQDVQLAGPKNISIENILNLIQAISLNKTLNLDLENFLSFAQEAGRIFDESTSSVLDLIGTGRRIVTTANILDLVHTVIVAKSTSPENNLELDQIAAFLAEFSRITNNSLSLNQTLGVRKSVISDCLYDPQGGFLDPAPVFGTATLTLTFPFNTPTTTLVLRNPNFGNTEAFEFSRINRESRGGTLLIFRDSKWPKQEILNVTIDALKEQQKQDLIDFANQSLGKEIGLLDNENRQWKGVIINPDIDITHLGQDNYSVSFQFVGEVQ